MSITQQERMMRITTPLDEDFLLINKMSASEGLSELFRFDVELLHEEEEAGTEPTIVDIQEILGQAVSVKVEQKDGTSRFFHGIVNNFSQGNRDKRFSYYYATVVPKIWVLTQNFQSQIFQQMSVPDILAELFVGFEVEQQLQGKYEPRNYCVQYRETVFDFASRLMEEEGIFYFFEHTEDSHKMIIADTPQSIIDCPVRSEIPCFLDGTEQEEFVSSIATWRVDYKLQSGAVTLWDFNFQSPKTKFDAQVTTLETIGGNEEFEIYDFPAGYARKYDGINKGGGNTSDIQKINPDKDKTIKTRMQELEAQYRTINAVSDSCSITAGYRFKLINHPNSEYNVLHAIVSAKHEIEQSPSYVSEDEVPNAYGNSFNCITHTTQFRPPQVTPKPVMRGTQTAFVVGPAGEEIYTDQYGRVKVQFHWDRDGKLDEGSSCWVRVAQAWAGNRWGMMFIPRVNMEVIVDFVEGDPDQPIITGCVYNAGAMPPYELPKEKTKMAIKSDSSIGGQGFNELRFEDKKGHEQVFIHAENSMDVRVKGDSREYIGNDRHLVVKNDRREKIDGDTHLLVAGDQLEEITGTYHLKVKTDQNIVTEGNHAFGAKGDYDEIVLGKKSISCGKMFYMMGEDVVIKGNTSITLKVGGNSIVINSGGIYIQGTMVNLNSGAGGPKDGSVANISASKPAVADSADDAKPGTIIELERRSAARKREKKHKEDKNKKSWIKIKLIDEAGKPVPGVRYKVTTPDGKVKSGSLNKEGKAHVKGFDPGTCKVTFPELDGNAWEDA